MVRVPTRIGADAMADEWTRTSKCVAQFLVKYAIEKTMIKEKIKSKILLRFILFLNILLPHSSINVIRIALNNS